MSTTLHNPHTRPRKLRAPAKVYRLIKRKVKGKIVSRFYQVRVRIARNHYKQKSAHTENPVAAREFAVLWIKQDFPKLCPLLGLTPLEKPSLPTVTTREPFSIDRTAAA
mgnify:CR=1 FL=1